MKNTCCVTGRLTALILLVCTLGHRATAQTTQYTITDLGTLPGFNSSEAGGLNASAQVAGWSHRTSGIDHAFVWTSGSGLLDLGTAGFESSAAIGVNALGQAAGEVYNSRGPEHADLRSRLGFDHRHRYQR